MSLWGWVLVASLVCFGLKVAGNLVPPRLLEDERFAWVAAMVTVGLLAAMVAVQTFADGTALRLDARVLALAAAGVALLARAPFIVVVAVGALVAAGVRALGWG